MVAVLDGYDPALVFESVLGQNTVHELKDKLALLLVPGGTCRLDAGAVCRVSTAAIQVIIAFLTAARSLRMTVTFSAVATPLVNAFEALGLADQLPSPAQGSLT